MSIYWPIALAVFADIFYQISAKSTPSTLNPFVGLTITYLVGAAVSLVIYYIVSGGGNIIEEYKSINWTSFVLGLAIVGLEAGSIYMYKVVEHEHRLHRQIHVSGNSTYCRRLLSLQGACNRNQDTGNSSLSGRIVPDQQIAEGFCIWKESGL